MVAHFSKLEYAGGYTNEGADMDDRYFRRVCAAVRRNDQAVEAPAPSKYVRVHEDDMLLFQDADGEMFAAAWRHGLVIDEAPFLNES